jgi:hypothetical protein
MGETTDLCLVTNDAVIPAADVAVIVAVLEEASATMSPTALHLAEDFLIALVVSGQRDAANLRRSLARFTSSLTDETLKSDRG